MLIVNILSIERNHNNYERLQYVTRNEIFDETFHIL